MNTKLTQFSEEIILQFDQIPADRKLLLDKLTSYIQGNQNIDKESFLMFICTHNSRRSHFGQILCALAADFYQVPGIQTFSAGTEVTAFHPNAIKALRSIGMEIQITDKSSNPHYFVSWNPTHSLDAYSKLIEDEGNPKEHFAAIMTCTHAEQNCPFVVGADFRIGLPYDDPKAFDGTAQESEMYLVRVHQIAREIFYVFSRLTH
jgi:arsenate reductase